MKYVFVAQGDCSIVQLISENVASVSKPALNALFKQGEIRLNGLKCYLDKPIKAGDTVSVFIPKKYISKADVAIIYADNNILIVSKPAFMDVENNLLAHVRLEFPTAIAVHRLDRNTVGLVVFALNNAAYLSLIEAFKARTLEKFYYALVEGKCNLVGSFCAYLKKDARNSHVAVYPTQQAGAKKIVTHIESGKACGNNTLVDIKLVTGRTHQIRAHLSFLGFPIVGDGKYGSQRGAKTIKLGAYKLIFNNLSAPLAYLNGKEFKTDINFID